MSSLTIRPETGAATAAASGLRRLRIHSLACPRVASRRHISQSFSQQALSVAGTSPFGSTFTTSTFPRSIAFTQPKKASHLLRPLLSAVTGDGDSPVPSSDATPVEDPPSPAGLSIMTSASNLPHPEKLEKGGEDAWFVRTEGGGAFGVADGVGGYGDIGIDAGLYAKQLMLTAKQQDTKQMEESVLDPRAVINAAHMTTRLPGACTAVVGQMTPGSNTLTVANIGDSGFRVIREGKIIVESAAQQHFFDCPYQLCDMTRGDPSDSAADAQVYEVDLQEGDLVVAGTDGLFDNVFDDEIVSLVTSTYEETLSSTESSLQAVRAAASKLSKCAQEHALDEFYTSPYAKECAKEEEFARSERRFELSRMAGPFGNVLSSIVERLEPEEDVCIVGGKLDDITVLVAAAVDPTTEAEALTEAQSSADSDSNKIAAMLQKALEAAEAKRKKQATPVKPTPPETPPAAGKALYSQELIDSLSKAEMQKILASKGLPTSGKIDALKQRLAAIVE